jgi:replicative DNA helicase
MSIPAPALPLDRALPQNPEAERSVLGSILIDNRSYYRVASIIVEEDFYRDAHRLIFKTMIDLAEQSREIDLITLKDELAKRKLVEKVGGVGYISSLVDGIPDIGNIERYANIVKSRRSDG